MELARRSFNRPIHGISNQSESVSSRSGIDTKVKTCSEFIPEVIHAGSDASPNLSNVDAQDGRPATSEHNDDIETRVRAPIE